MNRDAPEDDSRAGVPHNSEPTPELYDRPWVRWVLYVLIPLALLVVLIAGIQVSRLRIQHNIIIYSQKELRSGRPAALRVLLIDDQSGFLLPDHVHAELERDETRHTLFSQATTGAGYASGFHYTLPAWTPGPATLALHIRFDNKQRTVRSPIVIGDAPQRESLVVPDDAPLKLRHSELRQGGNTIAFSAEDRALFSGVPNRLFWHITGAERQPIATQRTAMQHLAVPGAPPAVIDVQTDAAGLFAMRVTPFDTQLRFALPAGPTGETTGDTDRDKLSEAPDTAGDKPSETTEDTAASDTAAEDRSALPAEIVLPVVYGGIGIDMAHPVLASGAPLVFDVVQLSPGAALYADLFHEGQWTMAAAAWADGTGKATFRLDAPPLPGCYRLQVTATPIDPGRKIAVRHFYVTPTDAPSISAKTLLALLPEKEHPWATTLENHLALMAESHLEKTHLEKTESHLEKASQHLAAFVFSRMYAGHAVVNPLRISRPEDDAELAAYQQRFQRAALFIIACLGLAVAIFIALMARAAVRREAHLLSLYDDAPTPNHSQPLMPKSRHLLLRLPWLSIILLLLVVLAAFAAGGLLLTTLRWY
ncbi:MAG: hypothetical protein GX146_04810 [Myxococcales bacterium]|nr:hypothetical protein [Myxococcales bacterium]